MVVTRSQAGDEPERIEPVQGPSDRPAVRTLRFDEAPRSPSTRAMTGRRVRNVPPPREPPFASTEQSRPTGGDIDRRPRTTETRLPRRPTSPVRSLASIRTTSSVTARIRQAQFEAEERLAAIRRRELEIESEQIRRKLAFEVEMLQEEEVIERPLEGGETERVERWLRSNVATAHDQGPDPIPVETRESQARVNERGNPLSPTPRRNNSRSKSVDRFVEAMEKLTNNRPPPRQTYELPYFNGAAFEWFSFKAAMKETTRMYGFTASENMARLRNCLKGEAREVVSALLYTVEDPEVVMKTLEQCFGRPEVLIDRTIDELKKLPRPGTSASELNAFAVRVQNMVSVLRSLDNKGYLHNPMITRDLMDKLSPHLRSRWCDYADEHRGTTDPEIIILSRFLMREADRALTYGYTSGAGSTSSNAKKEYTRATASNREIKKRAVYTTTDSTNEIESPLRCALCRSDHTLVKCSKFLALSNKERWDFVKKESLCFKCISSKHRRTNCRARLCGRDGCRHPHHMLLHDDQVSQRRSTNEGSVGKSETVTATIANVTEVKLKICPVIVSGPKGSVEIYALLDEGSTISLLDENVADQIGVKGPSKPLSMRGVNMTQSVNSKLIKFKVRGTSTSDFTMRAMTIPEMRLTPQTIPERLLRLDHLKDLDYRQTCYEQGKPQLLIGTDNWELIVSRELRIGRKNEPAASRTQLGWVIHGTLPRTILKRDAENVLHVYGYDHEDRLNEMVEEHFRIDALGVSTSVKVSAADERAVKIFNETAKRVDGRFEVGLPWREDGVQLPPSYDTALRRLGNIERKLDKTPEMRNEYEKQVQNLLQKGYAEPCDGSERDSSKRWYLPHFSVINPNKPGKVRLVFDAAAKSRGVSLNDFLLEGPDLLQSLQKILFRFRERPIAITADIQEMFLQVKISAQDQPAQLFLWRGREREQPPKEYKMTSMIFGASSSPFLAHSVRNRNAQDHAHEHPEAVRAIIEAHYMDDYVDSYDNELEAIETSTAVTRIHERCGFKLRSWNSNSSKVLESIPLELRAGAKTQPLLGTGSTEKTLGLQWNATKDTLGFNTSMSRVKAEVRALSRFPTKREALSAVMSLYDPLGLLSCYSITGKILLQRLWREKIGWDQAVPEEIAIDFMTWLAKMKTITELQLPRCYDPCKETVSKQLHVFVDASESAYATAAYWRLEKADGTADTVLVAAKAKVAPLRTQTIPRLELQAAVIGARLAAAIEKEHREGAGEVTYWTDSRTVQHWIKNDHVRYTPYVAHRIGEIAELTRAHQWRWIPTEFNVSDVATRANYVPATAEDIWFKGPDFLRERKSVWPQFEGKEGEEDEEMEVVCHTERQHDGLPDIGRFSSFERLIRTTAAILVFIEKCRRRATNIEVSHLIKAERLWIIRSQKESFSDEIALLSKGKVIPRSSRLFKLDPILREGILRVNGRIGNANVAENAKQPIILDGKNDFTKLVINREHRAAGHANQERVVNDLRQRYCILKIRPAVKAVARKCALCRVRKSMPKVPVTGDLPAARLSPYQRPFSYCGIDYFGPMIVTIGRRHEKRWGALFTCLTTRAIHLEMASSLSTDSAIMALRRMAARRGWPVVIYSDNGTNFKGADAELRAAYKEWLPVLSEYGLQHRVSWRYIPPGAPSQGGAWERLVRSVKAALSAVLNQKAPKEEVLQTLLSEVEYSINARPLTHVSVDPTDPEALTPNHFLLGNSGGMPLVGPCEQADRRTWRASQALATEFWRRWVQEYLPTLVPRQNAQNMARPLREGDLVVVVDPTLPRNTWPRGVVERVYPGRDGIVRSADVRTRTGTFRRPTTKLAVLPVEGSAEAPPGGGC